ncbi:nuclear protein UL24 [Gallid alphaherpesvirus 1]|uniref:Protein UL24 homolog n=3 Tax=Infectious laryngotracheitis virus TaxID=10386 RepID=UL24_ILTVT|nr:nuclear protein UL24 [Gallid alphaherpesvirus 1]YP_182353.1 nuclear protein UL24 [Gallid alphaherpesvirus 1]P23986.1 RecName: Full=Protein UL24 homolog; AltName: Full=ORF 3 [Infectious laryngotracheitis virus (strain Thorne V882)]ADK89067.1 UL24 nuclear protein [Gallid alphaherpesvirus 1]ADK89069.1 UL24 nuclear protein [Gallid alphaherpesvirus 1]ADK89071.1 UL24 nuclear protein [Gallid alphaherpesvirus 1]ADK89073.1 UL24 nuclear protein [Gallid alphaherpesvirus 1]ADK89075.1 UL24 nuclear pro
MARRRKEVQRGESRSHRSRTRSKTAHHRKFSRRQLRPSLRARLNAGIRCHNRFYRALVRSLEEVFEGGGDGRLAYTIIPQCKPAGGKIVVMFEVNLGLRKPDCICLLETQHEMKCIVIELKTCRFSKSLMTESKLRQGYTGTLQLRDSARLLENLAVPGTEKVKILSLLVFVAQRGMNILAVKTVGETVINVSSELFFVTLATRSQYLKTFCAKLEPRVSHARSKYQQESAKNADLASPAPSALQTVAALFSSRVGKESATKPASYSTSTEESKNLSEPCFDPDSNL